MLVHIFNYLRVGRILKNMLGQSLGVIYTRGQTAVGSLLVCIENTYHAQLNSLVGGDIRSVIEVFEWAESKGRRAFLEYCIVGIPGKGLTHQLLVSEILGVLACGEVLGARNIVYKTHKLVNRVIAKPCKKQIREPLVSIEHQHNLVVLVGYLAYDVILLGNVILVARRLLK